jgi:hypothetical protein
MSPTRPPRWFLVAALIALASVVLSAPAPASAATGSITLHVRLCPTGQPTTDIFVDCHSHPAPDGTAFRINGHGSKIVNSSGNIKFSNLTGGTRTITDTGILQPNEFLGLRVWCSATGSDHPAVEVPVQFGPQTSFRYRLATGAQAICDVYFIPEGGA